MNNWKKKDCLTIQGAANKIGVKRKIVEEWIDEGKIESREGYILRENVDYIIKEVGKYISLETFLKSCNCGKFDARYVRNREKYIDYLEENNYFGIKVIYPEELQFLIEINATMYFEVDDIEKLDSNSKRFFKYFGFTEAEKCDLLISECKNDETKVLLKEFVARIEAFTPTVTEFVQTAINIDFNNTKDEDLAEITDKMHFVGGRDMLLEFIKYANKSFSLKLGFFKIKGHHKEKDDNNAYPYRIYVTIAKTIFNEEELNKNDVLTKCFEKSLYFESWLFICAHFVCGWRGNDICNNWQYLSVEKVKELEINVSALKEDILQNRIAEKTYYELGSFIEKRIELCATKPHKTRKGNDLFAPIGNELKIFFGRMALISIYHHLNNGEGQLIEGRMGRYLNFVNIRELFGDAIYKMLGRRNLRSRKLNRSYIQSIEEHARKNGAGGIAAYIIAAYARNHSDIDTTVIYIHDHGLNGETADFVLTMMMDRGVFGAIRYKEFLAAFPDVFEKLSAQEQTKLLAECGTSSYELEVMGAEMNAELGLKKSFAEGNKTRALNILYEMFEIVQGFGKAKESGIYCKKRAVGEVCKNPNVASCIASVCPYLIFTEAGIKSLVSVVNAYGEKVRTTGHPKYVTILNNVIIPTYKEILSKIVKRMKPKEKEALKKAIGEYNGEYFKNN